MWGNLKRKPAIVKRIKFIFTQERENRKDKSGKRKNYSMTNDYPYFNTQIKLAFLCNFNKFIKIELTYYRI